MTKFLDPLNTKHQVNFRFQQTYEKQQKPNQNSTRKVFSRRGFEHPMHPMYHETADFKFQYVNNRKTDIL